jgi:hypothetical protein
MQDKPTALMGLTGEGSLSLRPETRQGVNHVPSTHFDLKVLEVTVQEQQREGIQAGRKNLAVDDFKNKTLKTRP